VYDSKKAGSVTVSAGRRDPTFLEAQGKLAEFALGNSG